jgi:hypothetical protein
MNSLKLLLSGVCLFVFCFFSAKGQEMNLSRPFEVKLDAHSIEISNPALSARWNITQTSITPDLFEDKLNGLTLPLGKELFTIKTDKRNGIKSSQLTLVGVPRLEDLPADPNNPCLAEHSPGKRISALFKDDAMNLEVTWSIIIRDGSNYFRQNVSFKVNIEEIKVYSIVLVDWPLRFPYIPGTARGMPVISGNIFCGFEHPMSTGEVRESRAVCSLQRQIPLAPDEPFECSSVIGVVRSGQLRRDFNVYVERERAHPYRPFLHYNTWYDLGYFTPFTEKDAVNAINSFGNELTEKRSVVLSSFLFDDGWDDHHTLWGFNSGFPNGFTPLKQAAAKYSAAAGVWVSPWGGYSTPAVQRKAAGKEQGFEMNANGLALSGPKYFQYFENACLNFIHKYGVNQFKIDGLGDATGRFPGSHFGSDFEAAIKLISDLRAADPHLYLNLTTGTWPSPFWLKHADSIWREGDDHSFAGVGSNRQQWITYRDGATYEGIVQVCKLYPLNSLMLHGIIYARAARKLETDPGDDFESEVHDYFGSGTQCQEMYITPALLSQKNWDALAEAANWSRSNSDVLKDTHWVGGNPFKGDVYGWASWSSRKAILVLRNPSDQPAQILIDVGAAFELPQNAALSYSAHSPWLKDKNKEAVVFQAGLSQVVKLKPFEVVTLDMDPKR